LEIQFYTAQISGYLFASGQAGERFAVRNSGAAAVIERMWIKRM
jgi:Glutamate synthase domain 3